MQSADVVIVGAGPVGLTLAQAGSRAITPYEQRLVLPQAETERLLAEAVLSELKISFSAETTVIEDRGTDVRVEFAGSEHMDSESIWHQILGRG